jgi:hypothetical protein
LRHAELDEAADVDDEGYTKLDLLTYYQHVPPAGKRLGRPARCVRRFPRR